MKRAATLIALLVMAAPAAARTFPAVAPKPPLERVRAAVVRHAERNRQAAPTRYRISCHRARMTVPCLLHEKVLRKGKVVLVCNEPYVGYRAGNGTIHVHATDPVPCRAPHM